MGKISIYHGGYMEISNPQNILNAFLDGGLEKVSHLNT